MFLETVGTIGMLSITIVERKFPKEFYDRFISKSFTPEVRERRTKTWIENRKNSPIRQELDNKLREMARDPAMIHKGKITKLIKMWECVTSNFGDIASISWIDLSILLIRLRRDNKYNSAAKLNDPDLLRLAGVPLIDDKVTPEMIRESAWWQGLDKWLKRYLDANGNGPFTFQQFTEWRDNQYKINPNKSPGGRFGKATYDDLIRLGAPLYNHRVVKIEKVDPSKVYDIKLDSIHNFALTCGIFVHNCGSSSSLVAEQITARPPARNLAAITAAVNKGTAKRANPMSSSATISGPRKISSSRPVHFPKLR